jgi:hypothetical protein
MGTPALRTITCQYCGKIEEKRVPKEQKFCSPKCSIAARTAQPKPAEDKKDSKVILPPGDPSVIAGDYLKKHGQVALKVQRLEAENKMLKAEVVNGGLLMDVLRTGIQALPRVPYIAPIKPKITAKKTEEAVLLFSDLHAAEMVRLLETDGFNEYNFDIFCRRLQELLNAMVDITTIQRNGGIPLKKLNIFSLGDIISGDIHFELERTNEMPLITSAIQTATVVAQFLIKMASLYEEILFLGVTGNHGRKSPVKGFKQRYDNIEHIIYQMLPLLTINQPNIKYVIPQSPFMLCQIFDWVFLLTHGDQKSNSFAGIPYYGLGRLTNEFQGMYRKRGGFDLACYGHYHTPAEVDGMLVNGSMVGTDEFAIQAVRKVTKPSQKFFGVSQKRIRTWTYDIDLSMPPEDHEFLYNPDQLAVNLMSDWTANTVNNQFTRRK